MTYDVVTIGAATIDAFIWSAAFKQIKSGAFSTGVGECFSLGSKIDLSKLEIATGGGATNAAATFANLGFKTACVTRLGMDLFGDGIVADLKTRRIATDFIVGDAKEHTGFSTILVMPSGERTVLTYRGASEHFRLTDIPTVKARWFYVTNLAGRLDVLRKVVATARRVGAKIFWNPGKADLELGRTKLAPILRHVGILDMNKEEAEMLGPVKFDCIRIITDGTKGAHAYWNGRHYFAKTSGVKSVNRTGAGDAFGSGFLAAWMKRPDIKSALALGTKNAESVIQKIGAKTGLLKKW